MAKSSSFFGLRRGSTKSLTFQVLDGKQVTKDRVSVVANPKTSAQATQRQKLLPAVRFQAIFHDLIDHSWENVQYGQKSIQHFMKKALRANIINGMVKGQTGWVPNPYQISEGSLPSMGAAMKGNGVETFDWDFVAKTKPTTFEALLQAGFQKGDQVTFIAVTEAGTNEQGIVYGMVYDRLILNPENLVAGQGLLQATTANSLFSVDFGEATVELNSGEGIEGCAIILSRRTSSKWLRSTEYLDTHAVDADIQRAIESYMQANVAKTSPWYLNAADNAVISEQTANNGEWVPQLLAAAANPGSDSNVYLGAKNSLYGNFAFVTKTGKWNEPLPNIALSSSLQLKDVRLSNFNYDAGDTAETIAGRDTLKYAGAFGSAALTAMPDEQPDELVSLDKVQ